MYEDKTLVCRDCGAEFVFTAGEQAFYAEKGFQNEPSRCKACRDARKANGGAVVMTPPPRDVRRDLRRVRQTHQDPLHSQERPPRLLQRVLPGS